MDMIGHQAVRQDLNLVSAAPFCHQFQVALVIFITKERLLPAVSTLGYVLGKTRNDDPRYSCHSTQTTKDVRFVNN